MRVDWAANGLDRSFESERKGLGPPSGSSGLSVFHIRIWVCEYVIIRPDQLIKSIEFVISLLVKFNIS